MFSSTERFDLSSKSEVYAVDKGSRNVFSVRISTAFILTLLAVAISVGVGLIVHFAGGNNNVVCQCTCTDSSNSGGQVGCPQQTTTPPVTCTPCPTFTGPTSVMTTTSQPTTTGPEDTVTPPITNDVILPTALLPKHYNVRLRPNLYEGNSSAFSLQGSVEIFVDCHNRTRNITLHIQNLNVTNGTIQIEETSSRTMLTVENYVTDQSARHFLIITTVQHLEVGKEYRIGMSFTGPLQNIDLSGLYYSTYKVGDEDRYLAITQFQPTDARKAFPSFDEPALKATFNITLERRPGMITLSNMPEISNQSLDDGYVADNFQETVVMPTYLLAFAVCDFQHKENITKNNHLFRTFSRAEYIEHTNYSLSIGSSLLDAFEDYFEIKYPLPKLDMIALPDFSAGAMENWGLVTYREVYMLYHPDTSTASQHMFTAVIVCHELAHMWFGNLISPKWWDDLWLNEGFASFFEYLGVDMVEDWNMMNYFALDSVQYSFDTDSLNSSRPIYQEVWTPDDINNIFDVITYSKGASVIRMMWFFLGKDNFRRGLSAYIRSKEYGNVQHDDLWEALTKESKVNGSGVDVRRVMDTWVEEKNYPLLIVKNTSTGISLKQERFLFGASESEKQNSKWEIPLTYTTNVNPWFEHDFRNITWMNNSDKALEIEDIKNSSFKWIILNIQEFGYYRVNYEQAMWNAIVEQLGTNHEVIHVVNRAALISDAFALNKAGYVNIETALHTLDYLDKEKDYVPWGAAIKELNYLDRMLVSRSVYGNFERFMIHKVNVTFQENKLNITQNQSVMTIMLQSSVASRACKYGISECSEEASRIFQSWRNDPDNFIIRPDIKPIVLCTAIRTGTSDDWNFVFSKYANSSATDQRIFIDALSCSRDNWILSSFLEYSIDSNKIRSQDGRFVILAVASNPLGLNLAYRFLRSRWEYIVKESGIGGSALNQIVIGMSRRFYTEYDIKDLQNWKDEHNSYSTYNLPGFDEGKEIINTNIAWEKNNYRKLEQWLGDKYPVY